MTEVHYDRTHVYDSVKDRYGDRVKEWESDILDFLFSRS